MHKWLFSIIILWLVSCSGNSINKIESVKIGKQTWMRNNLNVVTFKNGDTIPHARTNEEWELARFSEKPAWAWFNNDSANEAAFGKLYNWYAVVDPRGLAPAGWHIPVDEEWKELLINTQGKMYSVQRGGIRTFIGEFENEGMGFWWTPDGNESHDVQYAWFRVVGKQNDSLHRDTYVKGSGFSVRCIKDRDY